MDHFEDVRKLEKRLIAMLDPSSSSPSLCDIQLLELRIDSFFEEKLALCGSMPQPLLRSEIEESINRIAALLIQVLDKTISGAEPVDQKIEFLLIKAEVQEKITQVCENFRENTYSEAFQLSLNHLLHIQQLMELAYKAKLRSGFQYAMYLWEKGRKDLAKETADLARLNVPETSVTVEALEVLNNKILEWNRNLKEQDNRDHM